MPATNPPETTKRAVDLRRDELGQHGAGEQDHEEPVDERPGGRDRNGEPDEQHRHRERGGEHGTRS